MVRTCFFVPGFYEASGNLDLQPFARSTESKPIRPRASLHILARRCCFPRRPVWELPARGRSWPPKVKEGRSCFGGRWRLRSQFFSLSLRLLSARSTWPALMVSGILLPEGRERGIRHHPLLAHPRLRPARQLPRGHGRHRRECDAEPAPLQPRLPRLLRDLERDGERRARQHCPPRQPGARDQPRGPPRRRSPSSPSRSTTPASRSRSRTRTSRSRAGSRPTTAPSSSTSRREPRAGSRSTTTRRTRRPTTSR